MLTVTFKKSIHRTKGAGQSTACHKESYLNDLFIQLQAKEQFLEPGDHKYTFRVTLPAGLPSRLIKTNNFKILVLFLLFFVYDLKKLFVRTRLYSLSC
jgi:hypothetical protein